MPKLPDPATPEESGTINLAVKHAINAITDARGLILHVRPSDEFSAALDALDAARRTLQVFIDREG